MPTPRVTVIMPTYQRADTIGEAIESILAQDFTDFELIVVIDGATDGTGAVVAEHARRDPRIRTIARGIRAGIPYSRNEACRAARAPLIGMVDSDDALLPGALAAAVAFMDERPEVALAWSDVDVLEDGVLRRDVRGHDWPGRHLFLKEPWSSHFTVFRRDVWREVGGFTETIARCHTIDLYRKVADRHALARIPKTLYRVRLDGRNFSRANAPVSCEGCESVSRCPLVRDIAAAHEWRGHRVWKVALFLTTRCNFDCSYCFTKKYKLDLVFEDVRRLLIDAKNMGARTVTISGGEPSLYERLDEVVDLCCGALGLAVGIITNGWRWPEERLRRFMRWPELQFVVSLEGADEALHDRIRRRGSFGMVRDFVARLREIDPERRVNANVVVTPENLFDMDALCAWALEDLRLDEVRFDRAVPVGNALANHIPNAGITPAFLERTRALQARYPGRVVAQNRSHPGQCPLYADPERLEVVAYANGMLTPCCFIHRDEALAVGTIREPLRDVVAAENIGRVKRGLGEMFERFEEIEREKGIFTCVECQEEYQRKRSGLMQLRPLPLLSSS